MQDSFKYPGQELILFENATNWRKYFCGFIRPFLHGKILECGAGLGSICKVLNIENTSEWILLEPDTKMAGELKNKLLNKKLPPNCKIIEGTTSVFENKPQFDTILYIDVLEHIENDRLEMQMASSLLNERGKLIILSPAFPSLYSKFDNAIGHYKRYTKKELDALIPESMECLFIHYLDSVGFFASLSNKKILKQDYPTKRQLNYWDKYMIPVSKFTDRVFNYSFGKSILGIWEKK